jgi:hypothetical protein
LTVAKALLRVVVRQGRIHSPVVRSSDEMKVETIVGRVCALVINVTNMDPPLGEEQGATRLLNGHRINCFVQNALARAALLCY